MFGESLFNKLYCCPKGFQFSEFQADEKCSTDIHVVMPVELNKDEHQDQAWH